MREDIENVEASKPAHQIIYTTYNCNHEKKKIIIIIIIIIMYNVYI